MREKLQETLGENWKSDLPTPIMASEDFSYYLNDRLIKPVSITLMKLANFSF